MSFFNGYDLDNLERKCIKEVSELSCQASSEGMVLLKNEGVLPFDKTKTLSVFGRTQIDYLKSGTGSGGLVNIEYEVNVIDGLSEKIKLNEDLLDIYKSWLSENPFNPEVGDGWAPEKHWAQREMPITDEICQKAAEVSDYALIVIGRTGGESIDNYAVEESFLLTQTERDLIKTVTKYFDKVCVALNTGNIIDMKWVEEYGVPCVLYAWQCGSEGGNALADVLLGEVNPSGRLTDTIAYDIEDYPSTKNHGNSDKNIYEEDIYVGYRYFETFAQDRVLYPFGFGLSYTEFSYDYSAVIEGDIVKISAAVKNTGICPGKAVVQVYFSAPQGMLGKPMRELAGYKKTKLLAAGENETVVISIPVDKMASYDDIKTHSYILEAGDYHIYAGENVRDAKEVLSFRLEEKTVEKLRQALAPNESFYRIKPILSENGYVASYEAVTECKYDIDDRKKEHISPQKPSTGNRGIMLKDVAEGKNTIDEFILQLSDEDLTYLVKGEGMHSPKVTAGTASAFGGVTEELQALGVPAVCTADGPSGIRMDTGEKATLIANGTCLASTWNDELVTKIYEYLGIELRANEIDILLGPGINIHRSPLNGRNFEYFSEDPYLAGRIAAACTKGLFSAGVAGAVKHFACNSQESDRAITNAVVSERAIREIYLKPFEIAVKEGNASAIMTSYNRINGIYACVNYDLNTSILRDEWGYKGIVMTDWWATTELIDGEKCKTNLKEMVKAQNDLYKVVRSTKEYEDNLIKSVNDNTLDIYYLRKCAKNILSFILHSPAFGRKPKYAFEAQKDDLKEISVINNIKPGEVYPAADTDALDIEYNTTGSELAQHLIKIYSDGEYLTCVMAKGSSFHTEHVFVEFPTRKNNFSLEYSSSFTFVNAKILKKK